MLWASPTDPATLENKAVSGPLSLYCSGAYLVTSPGASNDAVGQWLNFSCASESPGLLKTRWPGLTPGVSDSIGLA